MGWGAWRHYESAEGREKDEAGRKGMEAGAAGSDVNFGVYIGAQECAANGKLGENQGIRRGGGKGGWGKGRVEGDRRGERGERRGHGCRKMSRQGDRDERVLTPKGGKESSAEDRAA